MSILGRYIFRQGMAAVVLILASLTIVTWIGVAFRQVDVMTSQGRDALLFVKLTSLALPSLIGFIAPFAVLLASLHVINRLSGDSELIIMTASGAPAWRLVRPLLLMALLVSLLVAGIAHFVAPWANRTLRASATDARSELISQILQPGRFTSPEARITVHIRDRGPDGELRGLIMHDQRDDTQVNSYLAETGYIVKQGESAYLLMRNGHIIRENRTTQAPPDIISFDSYGVDINRFEQKGADTVLRPREWETAALLRPDPEHPLFKVLPQRFYAELHDRFTAPFYPIAFVLISCAFAGQAATTRQNRTQALLAGFMSGVGLKLLGISAVNAANAKMSALPNLYYIPLGGIILAAAAIQFNMKPRRAPVWLQAVRNRSASVGSALVSPFRRRKPAEVR